LAGILKSLLDTTHYMTTTKVTVNTLNWFVKSVESALDKGNGEITIVVKNGKVYKKCATYTEYEDGEDIENGA
jgi:hypothetical protein